MPGAPIIILLNGGSGSDEKVAIGETIMATLKESGANAELITLSGGHDFMKQCENAVAKAKRNGALLVAAGGDGTVGAIAGLCYRNDVMMGIIPLGTFNYFARGLEIPLNVEEAAKTLTTGRIRGVSIGLVQDHVFLNNASFGLYTTIIRHREEATSYFGRMRGIAALAAMYSLFSVKKLFAIRISVGGKEEIRKTPMVFIGNNTLQLENLGLKVAKCPDKGSLAVVIMKETTRLETARMLLRGVVKSLGDESRLEEFCAQKFEMQSSRKRIDIVIDGEIKNVATPLAFTIARDALHVMAPTPSPPKSEDA